MKRNRMRGQRLIVQLFSIGALLLGLSCLPSVAQNLPPGQNLSPDKPSLLTPTVDVHFDQLVNTQIPLDLSFRDETGKTVQLRQYFDGKRPAILVMPFYKCMSGCTLELQGMAKAFNQLHYRVGDDFQVLTVSINPKEGPDLAAAHKSVYLKMYNKPGGDAGWHFLTGTQNNIQALAHAIGFHYVYNLQTEQFVHPNGIVILTPQGKTYRYFFGTSFEPQDLRIALTKASQNQIGTVVDQILSFCCSYDPTTGHYGVIIQRVIELAGSATVLILGSSILLMLRWERRYWNKGTPQAGEPAEGIDTVANATYNDHEAA